MNNELAWIESHQQLAGHPKTKKLARLANISRPTAIGHLHLLWWWALDYAESGDLSEYDIADIEEAALWEGDEGKLISALIESKWIDQTGDNLCIHDWEEYGGRFIDKRKKNTARKRASRERHARQTRDANVSHGATEHNSTVQDITEPKDTTPTTARADDEHPLPDPERAFLTVHEAYCELHKQLQASPNDVLAMHRTIAGGMPVPFIVKAMRELFAAKQEREKERFRKPRAFSYYEDGIREAWETEQLIKNGGAGVGGAQEGDYARGRRSNHSPNAGKGRALPVSDDELDEILQQQG